MLVHTLVLNGIITMQKESVLLFKHLLLHISNNNILFSSGLHRTHIWCLFVFSKHRATTLRRGCKTKPKTLTGHAAFDTIY